MIGRHMDATVVATPGYFATMGLEHWWLRRRAERQGPSPADYERRDTVTSLAMGVASLVAPMVAAKVLRPVAPALARGAGRYRRALIGTAIGAAAVTTAADLVARRAEARSHAADAVADRTDASDTNRATRRLAHRVASVGSVVAVATGGVAITTGWATRLTPGRMWERRLLPDLGTGPLALAAAILGWDFIYYWNHRFMHTSRYMWAIHVVHHSSERYNLSTALRQPVADALGTFAPYGLLCLLGIRPELVAQARGINLLYQYWIHTDAIRRLGPAERVLNTPSHHRVHHGVNRRYIDRNHGSILIVWDRLFGTFAREEEPVVYGLTKNIETFNPARVASHEHTDMLRDVAQSRTWRERLSFVLRGPGWAYRRHEERRAEAETPERDRSAA
jgi:sterol desaturase/sphingolipid hydroxylase (fatty acid hydroxylase superfamily)